MTEPQQPAAPSEPTAPPEDSAKPGWLARGATVLSLLACYGTLAVVAGLSALGVTMAVNLHVWAAAIVVFALVAVLGVGFGARRHGSWSPLILAALGAALVAAAMYLPGPIEGAVGLPGLAVEIAGFAVLVIAALWDWRLCKGRA